MGTVLLLLPFEIPEKEAREPSPRTPKEAGFTGLFIYKKYLDSFNIQEGLVLRPRNSNSTLPYNVVKYIDSAGK